MRSRAKPLKGAQQKVSTYRSAVFDEVAQFCNKWCSKVLWNALFKGSKHCLSLCIDSNTCKKLEQHLDQQDHDTQPTSENHSEALSFSVNVTETQNQDRQVLKQLRGCEVPRSGWGRLTFQYLPLYRNRLLQPTISAGV